jgi:voltage-gated potassium channel
MTSPISDAEGSRPIRLQNSFGGIAGLVEMRAAAAGLSAASPAELQYMKDEGWDEDEDDDPYPDEASRALSYLQEQMTNMAKETPENIEAESRFLPKVDADDFQMLLSNCRDAKLIKKMAIFDIVIGFVLVANAVSIGLYTDKIIPDTVSWFTLYVELGFLLIFTLEFAIRYWLSSGWRRFINDRWAILDVIVIISSAFDLLVTKLALVNLGFSSQHLALLRVFRLLRLLRLVRLLRVLRDLYLLVVALSMSVQTVFWGLTMITVVAYVFALLIYYVLECSVSNVSSHAMFCQSLRHTMVAMLRFTTYDVGALIRPGQSLVVDGYVLAILFVYVAITAIGIMNLIIAVMLTSTMSFVSKDSRCSEGTSQLFRYRQLRTLRNSMKAWFAVALGIEDGQVQRVSRNQVLDVFSSHDCEEIQAILQTLEIIPADIGAIFDEIESISPDGWTTVDDLIEGLMWLKGTVHPLEIMNVMSGLQSTFIRTEWLCKRLDEVMHALRVSSNEMAPKVEAGDKAASELDGPNETEAKAPAMGHSGKAGSVAAEEEFIHEHRKHKETVRGKFTRFDVMFTFIVLVNAVTLGVQVSLGGTNELQCLLASGNVFSLWCFVEYFFLAVYTFEFAARGILYYQMEILFDYRTKYRLPQMLFTRIFNYSTIRESLHYYPQLLRNDPLVTYEIILVAVGYVDLLIIRNFNTGTNLGILSVIRIVRLLKLVRLALRTGTMGLLGMMMHSGALLGWAVLILALILYFFALVFVSFVTESTAMDDVPLIKAKWSHIGETMISLFQIATLSEWGVVVSEFVEYYPFTVPLFVLFISITTFGVMNLITGIMVKAAFQLSLGETDSKDTRVSARCELEDAVKRMYLDADKKYAENQQKVIKIFELMQHQRKKSADELADEGDGEKLLESVLRSEVCRVKFSFWASPHQVGIEFDMLPGMKRTVKDVQKSAKLHWAGGMARPSMVIIETEGEARNKRDQTPGKNKSMSPRMSGGGYGGEEAPQDAPRIGRLIFSGVPSQRTVHFCFGLGFSVVDLVPVDPAHSIEDTEALGSEKTNEGEMTIKEFKMLIDDKTLIGRLGLGGFREDQALMVFEKLNVRGDGKVRVHDFIEGVMRMKQPVQGLDMAAAKSLMRRVIQESGALLRGSMQLQKCFAGVIKQLRGVNVALEAPAPLEASTTVVCPRTGKSRSLRAQQQTLRQESQMEARRLENEKLKRRAALLRDMVDVRRAKLDMRVHRTVDEETAGHVIDSADEAFE